MNRKLIIEKLIIEGFSERTLSRLNDNELSTLSKTVLKEAVMIKKDNLKDIAAAKAAGKTIETYESKVCPKCGMKNCKCKDKKHQDVNEIEEWVLDLAESKYSQFTSKNDIMSIISEKIETTFQPMPKTKAKKGHNGVPEFMTYDSIMAAAQPAPVETPVETPTKPKTPTRPQEDEPFDPFEPQPGPDTKPKALAEKKKIKK
jgi:phenylalanyl-tRNA synthetase alpha subunit